MAAFIASPLPDLALIIGLPGITKCIFKIIAGCKGFVTIFLAIDYVNSEC